MSPFARSLTVGALLCAAALAQRGGDPAPKAGSPSGEAASQQPLEQVHEACGKWLASDQSDKQLLDDAVRAVLADADLGLRWLGEQVPAMLAEPSTPRGKGLNELCTRVTLEFVRRQHKSGMVFVGQYAPLARLQPFVGELLFELLLATPEWYPFTFRVRLVPALRDLQPRIPAGERLDAVVELAEDDREPQDLRWSLAAMLHQWGRGEYADAVVRQLQVAATEGDGEDRVRTTLQLADYLCLCREYRRAASAHRAAQVLARASEVPLRPVAWYAAACVHALLGDKEAGMEALTRCAELHASPDLDKSLRLERKLFEQDPEIALLRADERFPALLKMAFGEREGEQAVTPATDNGR